MTEFARSRSVPAETSRAIDVIRGLSALGVIWGHAIYGFRVPLELNGAFWVWIFLALSGYLVAKSFEENAYGLSVRGYARFLWNRALRIVPLAWIALVAGVILERTSSVVEPSGGVWRQFLFVPPLNSMPLSGPLWTIATEVQFYAAALLLCGAMLTRRSRLLAWVLFAVCIWVAWRAIPLVGDNTSQPRTLVGNLPFFMFGVAIAAGRYDATVTLPRAVTAIGTAVFVAMAWYLNNFRLEYFWTWGPYRLPFGGAAACALAVAAIVLCTRPLRADVSPSSAVVRALAWCGFHTYGIYVYHSILTQANATHVHLQPGPLLLAFLLLAVAAAPLSYKWIEAPLLRFKARRVSSRADSRYTSVPTSVQIT